MTPLLLNNEKWTPSLKRFYNTYHSTAHFIGCQFPKRDPIARKYHELYRVRNSFTYRDGIYLDNFTVYTNNFDLLSELASDNFYKEKLDYVATPKDQDHLNALSSSEKIDFRSKYFYGKYEYRLESLINYYRSPPSPEVVDAAVNYIYENFIDTRVAYNQGKQLIRRSWFAAPQSTTNIVKKFPTIYTNDVGQLFMFKLAFGGELELEITKVVIV